MFDASRLGPALRLAILFYACGAMFVALWPELQDSVLPHIPAWAAPVTGWVAVAAIYLTIGLLITGVVPKFHRWRIIGCFVGYMAFLLNLLVQKNSGNVALEVSLVMLTLWSLRKNRGAHTACTASTQQWMRAGSRLLICLAIGVLAAFLWPVNKQTEYRGAHWQYMAMCGAFIIFTCLVMLEVGVMSPFHPAYPALYGLGCLLLTLSYLGEFNATGVVVNVSLACVMYGPLAHKLLFPPRKPRQKQWQKRQKQRRKRARV